MKTHPRAVERGVTSALVLAFGLGSVVSCSTSKPESRDRPVAEDGDHDRAPGRGRTDGPPGLAASRESGRGAGVSAVLKGAAEVVGRVAKDDQGGLRRPRTRDEWLEFTGDLVQETLSTADEALPELDPDLARQCGDTFREEVLSSHPASTDAKVVGFVSGAWEEVLEAARQEPREFRLTVVQDQEINAFAFVGRNIVVNTGFVDFAMTCAHPREVVRFALAHELAHVLLGHTDGMFRRMQAAEKYDRRAKVATGIVEVLISKTPINQPAERAADCYARRLHIGEGWSLDGGKEFFEGMMRRANDPSRDAISCLFRSHPDDTRRIELLETGRGCTD